MKMIIFTLFAIFHLSRAFTVPQVHVFCGVYGELENCPRQDPAVDHACVSQWDNRPCSLGTRNGPQTCTKTQSNCTFQDPSLISTNQTVMVECTRNTQLPCYIAARQTILYTYADYHSYIDSFCSSLRNRNSHICRFTDETPCMYSEHRMPCTTLATSSRNKVTVPSGQSWDTAWKSTICVIGRVHNLVENNFQLDSSVYDYYTLRYPQDFRDVLDHASSYITNECDDMRVEEDGTVVTN